MLSLDQALDLLLRDRAALADFLARGPAALDLAPADRDALDAVDRGELGRCAARMRSDLIRRSHRGSGSLLDAYPRTIAAWRAAHPDDRDLDELAGAFLASPAGADWREAAFAEAGLSLEEAFYRFAEQAGIGDAAVRCDEMCGAIIKALLLNPEPGFRVPPEVRRAPAGWYAIAPGPPPRLHAALGGRYVCGALTASLADLLDGEAARRHVPAALEASIAELTRLGLIARAA